MHGTRDRLIPFEHAERLRAACVHAEVCTFDADHNTPFEPRRYWKEIGTFLARHGPTQGRGVHPPSVVV